MSRKKLRRLLRAAAAAGLTVQQLQAWERRELPDDHPDAGEELQFSSRELGRRMIRVVERSGALPHVEAKMHRRRGRKRLLGAKALLVAIHMTAHLCKSYRRSDVCAVLAGLHPAIAQELGLVDHAGLPIEVRYKTVAKTIRWLEWRLRLGWYDDGVRCSLSWFANSMVTASVPRSIRRTVTAVAVDSTPVKAWARTTTYTRQADLDNQASPNRRRLAARISSDPYAKHRRKVLDDPDLPEPATRKKRLAAAAQRLGIEVGDDGRIIRGKDRDMRVGWATATDKREGHFYVGYELTVVVAVRSISWQGDPNRCQMGPQMPGYVLAMALTPAGTNPGPVGCDAVLRARAVAPRINEVIADRAYTVKRESFLRPLHQAGVNVVMDYPQRMIDKPDAITLGRRKQPALMHCGTIVPAWTPKHLLTPPAHLRGNSNKKKKKKKRQRWYADRAKLYRYSTNGRPRNGRQQFQCPVHAGRLTTPGSAASASYISPLVSAGGSVCCGGKVTAHLDSIDMDFYQRHPYGTPVWQASYSRRNRAESVIGKPKDKNRLGGEACKALGLAANTLAAVAVVVAYNRKLARSQKRKRRNNSAAAPADAAARPGGAARTRGPDTATDGSDANTPPRAPP